MSSTAQTDFLTGILEGFYGRSWPMATRLDYARYLSELGLNTYLYCPKGDPYLRRRWQEPWPGVQFDELEKLAARYRESGLYFGIGLSPFALYRDYGATERRQLRRKVEEIRSLGVPLLAILFDDMPGDVECLADRQAEIVADVCEWATDARVMICPTYYSFDPVLEKFFGDRPAGYWSRLGRALPEGVDIFWTGNRVCSEAVRRSDIVRIEAELGRRVMLWDNYPVNDGAERSRHVYCRPLEQRDPALASALTGHLCNMMNQGVLSLPALSGLATLYGRPGPGDDWFAERLGREVWALLLQYRDRFQQRGLDGFSEGERESLARRFQSCSGAAATELAAWLRGEYTFDPACLTD